jgi:hypothetical protein
MTKFNPTLTRKALAFHAEFPSRPQTNPEAGASNTPTDKLLTALQVVILLSIEQLI